LVVGIPLGAHTNGATVGRDKRKIEHEVWSIETNIRGIIAGTNAFVERPVACSRVEIAENKNVRVFFPFTQAGKNAAQELGGAQTSRFYQRIERLGFEPMIQNDVEQPTAVVQLDQHNIGHRKFACVEHDRIDTGEVQAELATIEDQSKIATGRRWRSKEDRLKIVGAQILLEKRIQEPLMLNVAKTHDVWQSKPT
jgi:hypothetical protein